MNTKPKILLRERFYIPITDISDTQQDSIADRFTKQMFQQAVCNKCEYLPDRPTDVCDQCPANLGEFKLFVEKKFKDTDYIGIPQGSKAFLRKHFDLDEFNIVDRRPRTKFKHKIEFTGKLKDYQIPAVKSMLKYYQDNDGGCGCLIAPPRSGKTVMATEIICQLGMKTLIIAKQVDWLLQFQETMIGSDTQKALTNIPDIQKFQQKKLIGLCKTLADFKKYDICLATYQTFLSDGGQVKYKELRDEFPIIVVDESHTTGALEFSKIFNGFNTYIRMGLTATFDRKDGMHWLVAAIAGPPIYTVEVETLKPTVEIVLTGNCDKLPKLWVYAMKKLCTNKDRNKLIVKHAMADLERGHSIVIPAMFVKHAHALVKSINKRAGETLAVAFTGGSNRRDIIEGAREGRYKVVVGTKSIVSTGINVQSWSCIYEIIPSSNIPGARQRLSRILTPVAGKQVPCIKYFLDANQISRNTFRNEFYNAVLPFIKPIISQRTWAIIKAYLANKSDKPIREIGGEF